jgi:anti-sigma B factor antagonist
VLEDDPVACSLCKYRGYADCAELALRGELDITDRAELSSRLAAVVPDGPWLIVDLTNLAYMDCSSLGVLLGARERARLAGGDVLLAGPRGAVARVLLLTGRHRVFPVFPSLGAAAFSAELAAFGTRLAADGAGKSPTAATQGMVTVAGTVAARADRGDGEQDQRLTATVTATAANG